MPALLRHTNAVIGDHACTVSLVEDAIELAGDAHAVTTPAAGIERFSTRLRPYGLIGIGSRVYVRPEGPLDARAVGDAGGYLATIWPPGWQGTSAWDYVCYTQNPLLHAVERRMPAFTFSEIAPKDDRRFGTYWDAWGEGSIGDGLGVLSFGRGRRVASLALVFNELTESPAERAVLRLAGMMLLEQSVQLTGAGDEPPPLSRRERDCMAYVAMGKTDWEIGTILGIAQSTAHLHVENARRKLGATNRAHAVARMAAFDLL